MNQGDEFTPRPDLRGFCVADDVFLFIGPNELSTFGISKDDGSAGTGFNVNALAAAFNCSPADLLLNNQLKALSVTLTEVRPTVSSASRAIEYHFALPDGSRVLTTLNFFDKA
jgi:hypothetical protein